MIKLIKQHILLSSILGVVSLLFIVLIFRLSTNNINYIQIKHGPVIEAIYGLGKVKAEKYYEIKLAIIKEVDKFFIREGSYVRKGDKLVAMVDGPVFTAPFDGVVTAINFSVAQQVFPQQAILRMEDFKNKYIEVSLEQQGALRVKAGLPVKVVFESIRGEVLYGDVVSIFPQNDEFLAHISVGGLGDNILPGMTADVAIEIGRKQNVMLIPLSAISNGRIRIQRNNEKMVVPVKIGNVDGSWAEVLESELLDTDLIIVKKIN